MRSSVIILAIGLSILGCSDNGGGDADAGLDADTDAGLDAGSDSGSDPGSDPGGDPGSDPGSDPASDPGPADQNQPQVECARLPPPEGEVVNVDHTQAPSLVQMLYDAAPGTTFLLADGTYDISAETYGLWARASGVTIRSESGNPESVTIDGNYSTPALITVSADNVTIGELTLTRPYNHPIHVKAEDSDLTGTHIYRVRIIDPGQQSIKINENNGYYADYGKIECCHIELTDAGRPHIRDDCYTGGVDAHLSQGWEIRLNTIKGFWCDTGLSEHGIHMWNQCRDTLVERNLIIDCARGIGFGLLENARSRPWDDNPYPEVTGYIGHIDGVIRNNFIFADIPGHDSGITLDQAHGTRVVHNTVVSLQLPFNSIEWRWSNTLVDIKNNLVSHNLMPRAEAVANLDGNIENAPTGLFHNASAGELHLAGTAAAAIDQGVPLESGLCDRDIDGEIRDAQPDVGADEWAD